MEIVVEDGTGVVGANSYESLEGADAYFENHPFYADTWFDMDPPKRKGLLIAATRQLDVLFNWYGYRLYNEQERGFPRQLLYFEPTLSYLPDGTMPRALKEATCEMAVFMSKGDVFASPSSEGLESLRLDVIELNFSSSSVKAPVAPAALQLLRGLGEYAFTRGLRKVQVG